MVLVNALCPCCMWLPWRLFWYTVVTIVVVCYRGTQISLLVDTIQGRSRGFIKGGIVPHGNLLFVLPTTKHIASQRNSNFGSVNKKGQLARKRCLLTCSIARHRTNPHQILYLISTLHVLKGG